MSSSSPTLLCLYIAFLTSNFDISISYFYILKTHVHFKIIWEVKKIDFPFPIFQRPILINKNSVCDWVELNVINDDALNVYKSSTFNA